MNDSMISKKDKKKLKLPPLIDRWYGDVKKKKSKQDPRRLNLMR